MTLTHSCTSSPLPATPEEALGVLAEENRKRRHGQRFLLWTIGGAVAGFLVLYLVLWWLKGKWVGDFATIFSMVALVGAAFAFTPKHKAALEAARHLEDPRLVGFLLEAYATSDERDVIEAARAGLLRSLPLLTDPEMLDPYQRSLLYRQLVRERPPALLAAVLDAVVRVSGAEAIPALERFSASARQHRQPEIQRLGERALQILPDLRIRKARAIIERRSEQALRQQHAETGRLGLAHHAEAEDVIRTTD